MAAPLGSAHLRARRHGAAGAPGAGTGRVPLAAGRAGPGRPREATAVQRELLDQLVERAGGEAHIGTDLLPALALGAEPPEPDVMDQPPGGSTLVDGRLLGRAFGVLGPTEAAVEMAAFLAVLSTAGWQYGQQPPGDVLLAASGAAFTAVVLGQLANAFACRSEHLPAWRLPLTTNRLLLGAVAFELAALAGFLAVPPVATALELRAPDLLGWSVAALAVPAVLLADAAHEAVLRRRPGRQRATWPAPPPGVPVG